ncbi:MAG: peptidase S10, partial [Acidobacteria bacterium]
MNKKIAVVALIVLALFYTGAFADQEAGSAEKDKGGPAVKPHEFVTHHKITIGKDLLNYTTVAGEIILSDAEGTQQASIFSISYTLDGVTNVADRPLTFVFNGGPGSSAVWLHLGGLGPKRINFPEDPVMAGGPPYQLVDNPNTILRFTDLVFVDPVGTGYSHALGKKKDSDYWGVDEDGDSIAEFIRRYLTKNKRWNSPLFLAGESYGTIRSSVLVGNLQLKLLDSVTLNGVILISSAIDVRTFAEAGSGNELHYVTNLPTYAATAYYHNVLPEKPADFDKFLQDVRTFASTEYLT